MYLQLKSEEKNLYSRCVSGILTKKYIRAVCFHYANKGSITGGHGIPNWKKYFQDIFSLTPGILMNFQGSSEKKRSWLKMILTPEDVQCLLFFGRTGVFPMSQGIIVNGRVIILSGPLVGEESRIRKVDRHKRRAWLQIKLFGKPYTVVVGLEISQKTAQEENSPSNTSLKARTDRTSAGVFHKKRKNYRKEMPKRDTVIETLRQKAADLWLK